MRVDDWIGRPMRLIIWEDEEDVSPKYEIGNVSTVELEEGFLCYEQKHGDTHRATCMDTDRIDYFDLEEEKNENNV